MGAYGLRTQIWNNNLKSMLLLAGFPFLLILFFFGLSVLWIAMTGVDVPISAALTQAAYSLPRLLPFAFMAAGIWFVIAWFSYQTMIDMATGARKVTRKEEPELYNLLENLCISRGLSVPDLRIIESPVRNAYASGLREGRMSVTLTRGLIDVLDTAEIEAVMGHELTHIRNRDVRLMVVAAIFAGIFSFVGQMLFRNMFYMNLSRNDRHRRSGGGNAGMLILIAFAIIAITWVVSLLVRMALSRKREFLADAGAVELTHNPDAMIAALRKISANADMGQTPSDIKAMFIENPVHPRNFAGLMATHPPLEKRIAALVMMGGKDVQAEESAPGPWG